MEPNEARAKMEARLLTQAQQNGAGDGAAVRREVRQQANEIAHHSEAMRGLRAKITVQRVPEKPRKRMRWLPLVRAKKPAPDALITECANDLGAALDECGVTPKQFAAMVQESLTRELTLRRARRLAAKGPTLR